MKRRWTEQRCQPKNGYVKSTICSHSSDPTAQTHNQFVLPTATSKQSPIIQTTIVPNSGTLLVYNASKDSNTNRANQGNNSYTTTTSRCAKPPPLITKAEGEAYGL